MGARSIYQKACPACAAVVERELERCSCGHVFPPDGADIDQAADENLYEAYLTARIAQGLETLEHARAALRAVPGDYARAVRVMEQVHELRLLHRELEAQRAEAEPSGDDAPCRPERAFATPTEAFRAAQAARAEIIARRVAARACSTCGARLEAGTARCPCGAAAEPTPAGASGARRAGDASPGSG